MSGSTPDLPNQNLHFNKVKKCIPWSWKFEKCWYVGWVLPTTIWTQWHCGSEDKESACNAGDLGSIPGSGRSPGGGHGNPLQYSCLGNPMAEKPSGLQSLGSCRIRHDSATNTYTHTHGTIAISWVTFSLEKKNWWMKRTSSFLYPRAAVDHLLVFIINDNNAAVAHQSTHYQVLPCLGHCVCCIKLPIQASSSPTS